MPAAVAACLQPLAHTPVPRPLHTQLGSLAAQFGPGGTSVRLLRLAADAFARALERDPLNADIVTEALLTRVLLLSDPDRAKV